MVHRDAERIDNIVRNILKKTNNRGIVFSGWSEVKNRSKDEVLYLDAVPYDWLLPQCKMIIHHGGAGTTSAGLRAGIPTVVILFTADQPFWGKRAHAVGVGPKSIYVNQLSVENLTHAFVEAEGEAIRKRAQAIGRRIRSEDGVQNTIVVIESSFIQLEKF